MRSAIGLFFRFICLLTVTAAGIFILLSYSPIDPIKAYIGNDLMHVPPEQYPLIAARWGLDQPLWMQFWRWFSQILQGDMGYSMLYNTPVIQVISDRLVPSLTLLFCAWVFSGVVGFGLGVIAGRHLNRWPDKLISLFCYLLASIPVFWIGLLLLSLFAVSLQWAPICCAWPIGLDEQTATFSQKLHHLVLPVMALGMLGVGTIALHTRAKIADVMNSEFIHYAQAQGDKGWAMMRFHVLKHAITPAICLQFASVGELLSGALLAEKVFAYPGLGQATIDAGLRGDIPLLMGIVLLCAAVIFFSNTAADIILRKVNKGVIRAS
ncbi:ABC transporter permease [Providencia sp. Je.9.19]|uniref:ABC transporter permease n=1 Tax=unclassified Providencia TaxID=2633465 RepID=UPI003DA876E5